MSSFRPTPRSEQPDKPEKLTHRQQQYRATALQLVLALAACFVVMFGVLALVPHKDTGYTPPTIDVHSRIATSQPQADFALASADMKGWEANEVKFDDSNGAAVPSWYVSYLGPDGGWLSFREASDPPESWVSGQYDDSVATGSRKVAGVQWKLRTTGSDGNQYMIGSSGDLTFVLIGQADQDQLDTFAQNLLASVD